ncbi:cell division control protein [Zalerion maritima]|uniref:Cell division control protein n=1 Tax=Zalerion maritima TaxID=339359 RepID=A0AAD5S2S8_9PEZI|nr:cell division control protein [Zalerion maritima]
MTTTTAMRKRDDDEYDLRGLHHQNQNQNQNQTRRHYGGSGGGVSFSSSPSSFPTTEQVRQLFTRAVSLLWKWFAGPGRRHAANLSVRFARRIQRNMIIPRLVSFPHLLVAIWVLVIMWGERWVFGSKVEECEWRHWERWMLQEIKLIMDLFFTTEQPPGAAPHHLIFVADPQLIDPHSYPGRPWPINPLTEQITDNYLRRSYTTLQHKLKPDTTMFLGDLFDGGREWKTAAGNFDEPSWARPYPSDEAPYVKEWKEDYGEDFWIQEYMRFNDLFFAPFIDNLSGAANDEGKNGQRGRKIIASLPGNHDLGFGAQVKIPARDRFRAYFGEENRIDVIGNHSIVSVDTVSLSAGTAEENAVHGEEMKEIYEPASMFLDSVKADKRKAIERELRFWRGETEEVGASGVGYPSAVEEAEENDFSKYPSMDPGVEAGRDDFPTILLTHVPLYRGPGTPCGPKREKWPPSKPAPGEKGPMIPDHRNAISVSAGYQYQNVLSESDSVKLVDKIGNVKHVFSGDDHDYCELVHDEKKQGVREITVKSISMAMGVKIPGFVMVSLWNPIDTRTGKSLLAGGESGNEEDYSTMQTHLCLLPSQLDTFMRYAMLGVVTVALLAVRAFLMPVMGWTPFALKTLEGKGGFGAENGTVLPMYKDKLEPPAHHHGHHHGNRHRGYSSGGFGLGLGGPGSAPAGELGNRTRGTSSSPYTAAPAYGAGAGGGIQRSNSKGKKRDKENGRWGWGGGGGGPKIEIKTEDEMLYPGGDKWKARRMGGHGAGGLVGGLWGGWRGGKLTVRDGGREFVTCLFRVVWMTGALWVWLNWRG